METWGGDEPVISKTWREKVRHDLGYRLMLLVLVLLAVYLVLTLFTLFATHGSWIELTSGLFLVVIVIAVCYSGKDLFR